MKLIMKIGLLLLTVFMAVSCTAKKDGDSIDNSYEEKTKKYACVFDDDYSEVQLTFEGKDEIESFEMKYTLKVDFDEEEFMGFYNEILAYFNDNEVTIDYEYKDNSYVIEIIVKEFNKSENAYNAVFDLLDIENGSEYLKIDNFVDYLSNYYYSTIECEEIE